VLTRVSTSWPALVRPYGAVRIVGTGPATWDGVWSGRWRSSGRPRRRGPRL